MCPVDNCVLGVVMNDIQAGQLKVHYQFGLFRSAHIALNELHHQAKLTLYRLGKF